MRPLPVALVIPMALFAVSCSGSSPMDPLAANHQPALAPSGSSTAEGPLATFTVEVDPTDLSATVALKASRAAQATDDVYLLSIENFVNRSTLAITAVRNNGATLDLDYAVTHPFAKPSNPDAPATAGNRADLGIAGRVLFLLDVPSSTGNTYFAGDTPAVANTSLITNADGYYTPAGLTDTAPFTADTFPYKILTDELLDPRTDRDGVAISNGGQPTGSYDAGIGGWQRSNIGDGDDWSGYGILHQGQVVSNTLRIDRAMLATTPFSFDWVILAKYGDPRGGANASQKRANRLPRTPADVNAFAYREPHASLDVEAVSFVGESGGFIANQISGSTLRFRVRDWDARAVETVETDLALDPIVTNVAIGESGAPALAVSIPAVRATTSW